MKSNTPESMKFKRLQRRLKATKKEVVGALELLWLAVAKNCPRGDIGKFSNEEIAIEMDWEADHDRLVAALVETGWLDEHDECRLVVHDWAEHAPHHVAGSLKRHGKEFVVPTTDVPTGGEEAPIGSSSGEAPIGGSSRDPPTKPNLTKPEPSVTKPEPTPNQNQGLAAARDADGILDVLDFEGLAEDGRAYEVAGKLAAALQKRRIGGMDSQWVWRHAALGELLKPGAISDIAAKVLERQIRKPKGYIEKALREECKAIGVELRVALERVPPMPNGRPTADLQT